MTAHHYLRIRLAAERLHSLRAMAALAEATYRELMEAYGFDSAREWRFDDTTLTITEAHGHSDRDS